jgi:hypothetical protein
VLIASASVLGVGLLPVAAQSGTPAPVPASLDGATVIVYQGTCDTLGEPLETLGKLEEQQVVNDTTPTASGANETASRSVRLLGEDINGNGKLDPGEDANGNGKLDEGLLANPSVVLKSAIDLSGVSEVWMLEHPIDPNLVTTQDQQRAMTVETGSGSETHRLACGDLPPNPAVEDTETQVNAPLYVDLAPTSDQEASSFRGFARFVGQSAEIGNVLQVVMFPLPSTTATPAS